MQLALTYDAAHVGASDWDEELGWFRRSVDVIGHKEVAYKLDIAPSNLTDALNERERKNVHARWFPVVLRMSAPIAVEEYMRMLCDRYGFERPARIKVRTPEEELVATRAALARVAPGVLALVDKELGR